MNNEKYRSITRVMYAWAGFMLPSIIGFYAASWLSQDSVISQWWAFPSLFITGAASILWSMFWSYVFFNVLSELCYEILSDMEGAKEQPSAKTGQNQPAPSTRIHVKGTNSLLTSPFPAGKTLAVLVT